MRIKEIMTFIFIIFYIPFGIIFINTNSQAYVNEREKSEQFLEQDSANFVHILIFADSSNLLTDDPLFIEAFWDFITGSSGNEVTVVDPIVYIIILEDIEKRIYKFILEEDQNSKNVNITLISENINYSFKIIDYDGNFMGLLEDL